jgi:hypothetical protein
MSMICIGVVGPVEKLRLLEFTAHLNLTARSYSRNISFTLDWDEPIFSSFSDEVLAFSVEDGIQVGNCEFLLMPDGYFLNNISNLEPFHKRIKFLQDIVKLVVNQNCQIEFFIGNSGSLRSEYKDYYVQVNEIPTFFEQIITIEQYGEAMHFIVV